MYFSLFAVILYFISPLTPLLPLFFLQCPPPLRALPSFPTRRSSDLDPGGTVFARGGVAHPPPGETLPCSPPRTTGSRSEEHTSELQSHSDLVCRLLLKNKNKNCHNVMAVPNPPTLDSTALLRDMHAV